MESQNILSFVCLASSVQNSVFEIHPHSFMYHSLFYPFVNLSGHSVFCSCWVERKHPGRSELKRKDKGEGEKRRRGETDALILKWETGGQSL